MERVQKLLQQYSRSLAIASALAGLLLVYFASAKPVHISVDGKWEIVHTHSKMVESILRQANIEIIDEDRVVPDISSSLGDSRVIEVIRSNLFNLIIDGKNKLVRTTDVSVVNILAAQGIKLLPGDRIWIDGIPERNPERVLREIPISIQYESGDNLTLNIDGVERNLRSAASTVGEALTEVGIEILEGDQLTPASEESLTDLEEIIIRRSTPVTILYDGLSSNSNVVADSVGEALQKAGVPITGLDYAIPEVHEVVPEDGVIKIIRVTEEVIVEQTPLPFETEYVAYAELEIDNQTVLDNGAYGILANQIRVRYEDGEEVNRAVEGEWVAREPQTRKIGYGTNIVIRTTSTADGPIQYWRAIQMWATSYSPSRAGVPDDYEWFGITACGKKLVKGLVAIDNRYIPFYTKMYVPGYGFAEACDTGSGVKGRWIDLGYEDHNYKSWHQYVTVYFLTPVPPANSIAWIFP